MIDVYIAVGSNIKPRENVYRAVLLLKERIDLLAVSAIYRTQSLNREGAPDFANGVVAARTDLEGRDLKFGLLRDIEAELGRRRTADRNAPRTIDLDLILYGDRIIREPDLVIPDPELLQRSFLAVPLAELAPQVKHPVTEEKMRDIASRMGADSLQPWPEITSAVRTLLADL